MTHRVTTTIMETTRERSDSNGNPRFTVNTAHGVWKTVAGGQVAMGITNSEYQGDVVLTMERNQIVGVATLDGKHFTGRQG